MCLRDHHRESVSEADMCESRPQANVIELDSPSLKVHPFFYICKYKNTNQDLGDLKVGSENPQEVEL